MVRILKEIIIHSLFFPSAWWKDYKSAEETFMFSVWFYIYIIYILGIGFIVFNMISFSVVVKSPILAEFFISYPWINPCPVQYFILSSCSLLPIYNVYI